MVVIYKAWCPCPEAVQHGTVEGASRCKKGNTLLYKHRSADKVREAIYNHLTQSPYHNFSDELANNYVDAYKLTMEDSEGPHQEPPGGEGPLDEESRKKRPRGSTEAAVPSSQLTMELPLLPAASMQLPDTDTVTLRTQELQMVLDSIKRAALNVRSAERLCETAAQTFRMEATALEAAHTHT